MNAVVKIAIAFTLIAGLLLETVHLPASAEASQPLSVRMVVCPPGVESSDLAPCRERVATVFRLDSVTDFSTPIAGSVQADGGVATVDVAGFTPATLRVVVWPGRTVGTAAVECFTGDRALDVTIPETYAAIPVFDLVALAAGAIDCTVYIYGFEGDDDLLGIVPASGVDQPKSPGATTDVSSDNTLTLRISECPLRYDGDDFAADCAGNPVAGALVAATAFDALDGATDAVADADGVAVLDIGDWQEGRAHIVVRDPEWLSYAGAAVCTADSGWIEVRAVPSFREGPAVDLSVTNPVNPTCDVYVVPFAERGEAIPLPAADETALVIHSRACPPSYKATNYYQDCHDAPIVENFFTLDGPVNSSGFTEGDGNVAFGNLPPGDYTITGGIPSDFGDLFVYCSISGDPSARVPVSTRMISIDASGTAATDLTLPAGAAVVCDAYYLPI